MSSRILLVEDEPGLRLTVSDLLATEGHHVETASDGEVGLNRAAGEDFDLVILDVMLPKKTGFDVCRELRQRGDRYRHLDAYRQDAGVGSRGRIEVWSR